MSSYRVEQRRVAHRGKEWHFVSYEAPIEKLTKSQGPPMWYLMASGKRWQVMEQRQGQDAIELDRELAVWLDRNILG